MFRRSFKIVIFTIAIILAFSSFLSAGITVTPSSHKVELTPGESTEVEFQIYNSGPEDLDMTTDPKDWVKLKENKNIDINSWLKLEPAAFKVKKDKTVAMKCKIKTPEEAIGELVAMIYLCYKKPGSVLNIRYGNPLYIYIKGTGKYGLEIKGISFKKAYKPAGPGKNKSLSLIASVELLNTGNRHLKPDIKAYFYNETGEKVGRINLLKKWPIFGGQTYKYNLEREYFSLPAGKYKVMVTVKYQDKTLEEVVEYEVKAENKEKVILKER